jgi:hypothetical protein
MMPEQPIWHMPSNGPGKAWWLVLIRFETKILLDDWWLVAHADSM